VAEPPFPIAKVSAQEHPPTTVLEIVWDQDASIAQDCVTIPARVDQPTFVIAMERAAQLEKFQQTSRIAQVLVSNRLAFPRHLDFSDPSFKLTLPTRSNNTSNNRLNLQRRLPSRRRTLKAFHSKLN
jgi:hypothetical protein